MPWTCAAKRTAISVTSVAKTLRNYRRLFIEQGLDELLFRCLTDRLVQGFSVDTSHQRMDSTALRSAMRALTRREHWNAECVGWHVCKRGDRFAALQPISMGLAGLYGSTAAGAARGLALRMDHGSQYLSDHFTNQIKFWGIQPSYAFVAEPQTNGVAERFNRTLKEQIIHGRIYRNIAELRDAVRDFVELYNAQWIVEKNGYLSPAQARQAWHAAISIRPAA